MSRVGWVILVCVCAGCSSAGPDSGSAVTTTLSARPASTSSDATSAAPTTGPLASSTAACSADNDPLAVAKTFIVAAETNDQATITRCTYPAARLSSDLIEIVASGELILDQVRPIQENSLLKVGPDGVGFDFPAPPQSRGTFVGLDGQPQSAGPDHQGGVQIAVTLEPDGLRYVTDVLGYASG